MWNCVRIGSAWGKRKDGVESGWDQLGRAGDICGRDIRS
jgi:hypothetical protein